MLTIVLPIAGRGSRFLKAGYAMPKPLISVHGVPMIELVVRNIRPLEQHRLIFVAQEEHLTQTGLRETLHRIEPEAEIVAVPGVTEGPVCSVLAAKDLIATDEPLMIANSDQWVACNINEYLVEMDRQGTDGLIMTMWANHPKWSYVAIENGRVTRVAEKEVISEEATVGIYNFRRGRDFIWAATQMIGKNQRINNEFYVAPVYNELIAAGMKIAAYNVGRVSEGMWGLGTPDDLEMFLSSAESLKAVARDG